MPEVSWKNVAADLLVQTLEAKNAKKGLELEGLFFLFPLSGFPGFAGIRVFYGVLRVFFLFFSGFPVVF